MQIPFLVNKTSMQFFLGKINFLHKLIFDSSHIFKPILEMIKNEVVQRWEEREKNMFSHIKQAIVDAPALYNPYCSKDCFLYTFSYNTSLFDVITQKDDQNNEKPISFMRDSLQRPRVNYPTMDKKYYVVYKVLKHF